MSVSEADFREVVRKRHARARDAVAAFVNCAASGDVSGLGRALVELQSTGRTASAFRAVGRLECVPDDIRQAFVSTWLFGGNGIRDDVSDDRSLKAGLRRLLPAYQGGPLTLFRGDSAFNRRRRSYGLCWTTSDEVARSFASDAWRAFEGGSVLLRCVAPATAVLYAVPEDLDHYEEREVIVDPRQVGRIEVVERFSQVDP